LCTEYGASKVYSEASDNLLDMGLREHAKRVLQLYKALNVSCVALNTILDMTPMEFVKGTFWTNMCRGVSSPHVWIP
jgi:hypothetical protein